VWQLARDTGGNPFPTNLLETTITNHITLELKHP
jgi:hypothetical protein